ncbi:uncharacterized protein V6R79_025784 [Siganus canaliculatus]
MRRRRRLAFYNDTISCRRMQHTIDPSEDEISFHISCCTHSYHAGTPRNRSIRWKLILCTNRFYRQLTDECAHSSMPNKSAVVVIEMSKQITDFCKKINFDEVGECGNLTPSALRACAQI